jgi:hypothetical protein
MDPKTVKLYVSPCINEHANMLTSENESCAITFGSTAMVLRAENQAENVQWIQTLRARLLDTETSDILKKFYNSSKKEDLI